VGGEVGKYLEITNPWDGNDSFQLDWNDFFVYFTGVNLYGDAAQYAMNKGFKHMLYNKYDQGRDTFVYDFYNASPQNNSDTSYKNSLVNVLLSANSETVPSVVNPFAALYNQTDETEILEDVLAVEDNINNAKKIILNIRQDAKNIFA
jgi:hypothetical protein